MTEVKIEITEQMIKSVLKEKVNNKLKNIDIKSMVHEVVSDLAREKWDELRGDQLVKNVKTSQVANRIVSELSDRIVHAFDDQGLE